MHATSPAVRFLANDRSSTFPEADPRMALALAIPAQNHLVAVLEKLPRLSIRQRQRLRSALRQFQQTAQRILRRARHRPRRQQIARLQIAPVAR
jgi:hypothetical protein